MEELKIIDLLIEFLFFIAIKIVLKVKHTLLYNHTNLFKLELEIEFGLSSYNWRRCSVKVFINFSSEALDYENN